MCSIKSAGRNAVILLLSLAIPSFSQILNAPANIVNLGSVDATGAITSKSLKSGNTLPGSCGTNELFFKSNAAAGQNIYGCIANVWTAQGGVSLTAGPNGTLIITGNVVDTVDALVPKYGTAWANTGLVTGSNVKRGTGTPLGVVAGSIGDIFERTDGGAGTTLYVKESGSPGSTSGWNPPSGGSGTQVYTKANAVITGAKISAGTDNFAGYNLALSLVSVYSVITSCTANDDTGAAAIGVAISGTTATFTTLSGAGTQAFHWICVGTP